MFHMRIVGRMEVVNKLWVSIHGKWLEDDPVSESLDSGYSCFDKIDNDFDKVIEKKERDCTRGGIRGVIPSKRSY